MLLLLFLLFSECSGAQYPYRMVRRTSPMEALERLRYLPVDYSEDEYQVYALPPQWTSDEYEYYAQPDPEELGYNEWMRSYLQQVQRRSDVTPPTSPPPPPQVTGVPGPEKKKSVESMVVADPPDAPAKGAEGQKEEPLFRPQQTSQRTTAWNKTPIPLLKQMMIGGQKEEDDVLLEELNSLKKKH